MQTLGLHPVDVAPVDSLLLLDAAAALAGARQVSDVTTAVSEFARALTGADGVTFVLREGDRVHYVDEEAVAPLWKGQRFPADACISGWAMIHRRPAVIEDVQADDRIPHALYRATFVQSLVMVPVRPEEPVGAIGAYWAHRHRASPREVELIEALAGFASLALANVALLSELRRAVSARDDFLALASHELRTPLGPLRLQLDAMARRSARGEQAAEAPAALARMRRNVDRLSALVDELLDASRVAAGHLAIEPERVDVGALARGVADRLAPDGRVAAEADGPVEAWVDPRRVEQVLENLVGNALKFGGGGPVRVRAERAGDLVRLAVSDDGDGIAPEDQARIFERFERAVSTRAFGGLGLGLWLVRELVEAHGGRVSVESAPGHGATFTVVLPAAPPQAVAS